MIGSFQIVALRNTFKMSPLGLPYDKWRGRCGWFCLYVSKKLLKNSFFDAHAYSRFSRKKTNKFWNFEFSIFFRISFLSQSLNTEFGSFLVPFSFLFFNRGFPLKHSTEYGLCSTDCTPVLFSLAGLTSVPFFRCIEVLIVRAVLNEMYGCDHCYPKMYGVQTMSYHISYFV